MSDTTKHQQERRVRRPDLNLEGDIPPELAADDLDISIRRIEGGLEPSEGISPNYLHEIFETMSPENVFGQDYANPNTPTEVSELPTRPNLMRQLQTQPQKSTQRDFTCPHGLSGNCGTCRWFPCNSLTVYVMQRATLEYMHGGRLTV